MGWDATFYFAPKTKRADVEHFLGLIGYKKTSGDTISRKMNASLFYFPPDSDPARLSDVTASVYTDDKGQLVATSRANIWCTSRDTELQNLMLRELKKYFKGTFETDLGKNRYFTSSGAKRLGVEAACYTASCHFLNSIKKMSFLNSWILSKAEQKPQKSIDLAWIINQTNPAVLAANLGTVYLVSLLEEFFKTIFVETLRSARKELKINRFRSPTNYFIERAYQGEITLEEAVAENVSFQNSETIRQNFSGLPFVGFIDKYIGKPISSRGKVKRAEVLQDLFDRRHAIVHRAELDFTYLPDHLSKHIRFCERLVGGLYRGLAAENKWPYEVPW
jgi:hypothetical protein